jgi:phage tail tape-measure protein
MSDETKPVGLWERTKAWADRNRTISGALVGGAAGTIVPVIGTVIGTIVGAGVGFASSKEKKEELEPRRNASETTPSRRVSHS